ncbi:type IV pilus modification protein PilV [Collimonas sp. OK412]|jgi:type IV pilus assembly protein PilV|uniref:type IV pilus modification protein PilV n=1 Tax=Collimonas sp. (strain OK412) TaxID=1801619 RepID=UPI0008EE3CB8|nr:type IV pilus modification protein PilV [Collimonas sp. OK412]SFC29764.1 type IV pilus assembly protein PilV [Collimonas sp. OK412]
MISAGSRTATQSGIGMIEVLVAIAISAFALFALMGMQTAALRYQKTAHLRATASQFSADLADRVRANIRGAHGGAYNLRRQAYPDIGESAPSCLGSSGCTPQELAAKDIHEWRTGLSQAMAGGWGEIAGSVAEGFMVKVYFLDSLTAGDARNQLAKHCRPGAADLVLHKDVVCFATAFYP